MFEMRDNDHYAALNLSPGASAAEIKRRYRALMRQVHPDANARDPHATRKAARINAAYEVLGDAKKRREYDASRSPAARNRRYEQWAQEDNWEDIVAENVPPVRPTHRHDPVPIIEPDAIEVDMAELRTSPRVRRTIRVTNQCTCTLVGDVSTSEPWVWGPIGRFTIGPGDSLDLDIEVVARRVTFPGVSRVQFVSRDWTGTVPVRVTGYTPKVRRYVRPTESRYVPPRRRRAARR
jgi:hypothetical protein